MSSANDHRRYAAECLALAERVSDTADRARLLQMAQAFLDGRTRRNPRIDGGRQGMSALGQKRTSAFETDSADVAVPA